MPVVSSPADTSLLPVARVLPASLFLADALLDRGSCVSGDGDTGAGEMVGTRSVVARTRDLKLILSSLLVDIHLAAAWVAWPSSKAEAACSARGIGRHWDQSTWHNGDHYQARCCCICKRCKCRVWRVKTDLLNLMCEQKSRWVTCKPDSMNKHDCKMEISFSRMRTLI